MKNVDFNEIKKILLERKLPDYDDFFEVLNEVTESLENEDESYRPKNDDGKCGSLIDFQNEDRLTLVIPDLHARPDFLLNILSADVRKIINENESDLLFCGNEKTEGAESGKTVFEMVQNDLIRLVFLGDILHSENNRIRWYQIEEEFEQKQYSGEKMCIEMGEGLSLLFCLCRLKSIFPKNIHILKGNHENILNKTGDGDFGFKKFVDEGEMCRLFVQNYYGDDILFLIHCFEKELPLVYVSKNVVVSHAEPKISFSRKEIINARKNEQIIYAFTWTANDEAEEGSVCQIIKNLICDDEKENGIQMENENQAEYKTQKENENQNENDYVYIAGHRPVKDNFALRQGGKFIQIHNVKKQNVAVVKFWKKFSPENDIVSVF